MTLPTDAILPFAKAVTPPLALTHTLVPLQNTQARLAGRIALLPGVNLDDYRFRAVIDWIEFQMHLGRHTQARYVQDVLRQFLPRNSHIAPQGLGPGDVFSICTIKIQEPESFAQIAAIHQSLIDTFGEASGALVTEMEISVDAYPKEPSDLARALLLGAMQRTIWTDRDIWSVSTMQPRSFPGKNGAIMRLSPPPPAEVVNKRIKIEGERANRSLPNHHNNPPLDATMYLGSKNDDVMIRVMDKVIDEQNPKGLSRRLDANQKRVRVEVTLKGNELNVLGVSDIASLSQFKLEPLQKRYFQFRLPTFSWRDNPQTGADVLNNTREEWRAQTYLRSGVTGLVAMDTARDEQTARMRKGAKKVLDAMDKQMTPLSRRAPTFLSYEAMNRKVTNALGGLARREATAWEKLKVGAVQHGGRGGDGGQERTA